MAKAAALLKTPAIAMVSTALPDLKLSGEEIALIAALGKARDAAELSPQESTFRVTLTDDDQGVRRADIDFSNRNYGRTKARDLQRLITDILDAGMAVVGDYSSTATYHGTLNNGAITNYDEGSIRNFPISDLTKAVETVAENRQKTARREA